VVTPEQGEIWWATADTARRPVLVVTRTEAIPVLNRILVAPVSRTVRDIPTEIPLGPDEGLPQECAASFDNLQPLPRHLLTERVGRVRDAHAILCRALGALADC
jgi:mRNA interferase MazF